MRWICFVAFPLVWDMHATSAERSSVFAASCFTKIRTNAFFLADDLKPLCGLSLQNNLQIMAAQRDPRLSAPGAMMEQGWITYVLH